MCATAYGSLKIELCYKECQPWNGCAICHQDLDLFHFQQKDDITSTDNFELPLDEGKVGIFHAQAMVLQRNRFLAKTEFTITFPFPQQYDLVISVCL